MAHDRADGRVTDSLVKPVGVSAADRIPVDVALVGGFQELPLYLVGRPALHRPDYEALDDLCPVSRPTCHGSAAIIYEIIVTVRRNQLGENALHGTCHWDDRRLLPPVGLDEAFPEEVYHTQVEADLLARYVGYSANPSSAADVEQE